MNCLKCGKKLEKNNDKIINLIIGFETVGLSGSDELFLFSDLIKSNKAYTLQGMYGRHAQGLIDDGYLDVDGNILKDWDK